jgi:hypothetical protein
VWTGPLPQGFSAIAAAKGIALKQPLSLAPALLQAMRQNLRHTSLSAALQVRSKCLVTVLLHPGKMTSIDFTSLAGQSQRMSEFVCHLQLELYTRHMLDIHSAAGPLSKWLK